MNDFIGNHIKFIAEWGQTLMGALIVSGLTIIYLVGRNNKYFLPKGFLGWTGLFITFLFVVLCSLIFARVTMVKPGVTAILKQLESLKDTATPPLTFKLVADETPHEIREYRGKVVLLNYWATWCRPCLKEIPDLNRLQSKYEREGLVVIALSDEERERLLRFSEKHPLIVAAAYAPSFDWVNLGSERPATFLIDRKGVVREYYTGPYDYDFFESEITRYLKE